MHISVKISNKNTPFVSFITQSNGDQFA